MKCRKPQIGIAARLCAAVVLLLGLHVGVRRAAATDNMIEQLAEPLKPLFSFQLKSGQLVLDRGTQRGRIANANRLIALFSLYSNVRAKANQQLGPDSSDPFGNQSRLGNDSFFLSFRRNDFRMRISATKRSECVQINELRSPKALYFSCDEPEDFRLEFTTADDDLIVLQQHADSFAVLTVRHGELFCETSESFIDFVKQHHELMTGFILPALKPVGIYLAAPIFETSTREAALEMLRYETGANANVEQLLADLTNEKRQISEPAQKTLIVNYDRFQSVVKERLQSDALSLQTRRELDRIVRLQEITRGPRAVVAAFELLDDPAFLVSLLDDADPREFVQIVRRLEKVTGQKLGTRPEMWKALVKENKLQSRWGPPEE